MAEALSRWTTARIAALGTRVRRIAEGRAMAFDAIARAIVALVAEELDGLVLVRAHVTRPAGQLAPEARAGLDVPDDTPCLVLVASAGLDAARRALDLGVSQAAVPLPPPPGQPMLAALLRDLDADGRNDERRQVFHVADAADSPLVPAQRELVLKHGVRSVVGCGGKLADGHVFALVLFASHAIPAALAHELDVIGVQARLALLAATDGPELDGRVVERYRAERLEELLRLQEYRFQLAADRLEKERDALASQSAHAAAESASRAAADAERLRRTQRATLNVIEDLREARDLLEARVSARTAELAERNRELEEFAYIASHDLQEPLRTIAGYLQLLEQRYAPQLDDDARDFVRFSVEGAHRLQALIEALLTYSRASSREPSFTRVPLDEVVDDVLRALALSVSEAQATIERGPLPVVRGDRVLLGQVFQNLIGNALKFRGDRPAHVRISATSDATGHHIEVADRGIGFDNRHAERVFGVFRRLQRKYAGTGIGLAVCKKLVERHRGTIRASASPGQGATFALTLPLDPDDRRE